jgi:protein phosphatase
MIEGRHYAARQIQGARNYQEDEFGFLPLADGADDRPHSLLAVLADGMGGHKGGAHASAAAVESFVKAYGETDLPTSERLRLALARANERIGADSHGNPELEGMGCTLVGAAFTEQGLQWISVGDSPFWLFRGDKLIRLNADHSMAPLLAEQVAAGKMTEIEAARHPQRNALRSAVIGDTLPLIDLKETPLAVEPGDRFVLSSDGLETLADEEIAQVLREGAADDPESVAARLLAAVEARNKKGQDNTTVIVVEPYGADGRGAAIETPTIIPARAQQRRGSRRGVAVGVLVVALLVVLGGVFAWWRDLPPFSWLKPKQPAAESTTTGGGGGATPATGKDGGVGGATGGAGGGGAGGGTVTTPVTPAPDAPSTGGGGPQPVPKGEDSDRGDHERKPKREQR